MDTEFGLKGRTDVFYNIAESFDLHGTTYKVTYMT